MKVKKSLPTPAEGIEQLVRQWCADQDKSVEDLAALVGISATWIYRCMKTGKLSYKTLVRIFKAMGLPESMAHSVLSPSAPLSELASMMPTPAEEKKLIRCLSDMRGGAK